MCWVSSPPQHAHEEIEGSARDRFSCSQLRPTSDLSTAWCGGLTKGRTVCYVVLLSVISGSRIVLQSMQYGLSVHVKCHRRWSSSANRILRRWMPMVHQFLASHAFVTRPSAPLIFDVRRESSRPEIPSSEPRGEMS